MTKLNSRWLNVTEDLPVNNHKITNLQAGVDPTDAVNVSQLTQSTVTNITQLVFGPTSGGTIDEGAVAIDTTSNSADVVEEINVLLGYLVPPAAPNLSSFSSTAGVSGKLSFGPSNNITGYTNHPTLDINATYSVSGNSRGIISGTQNVSGTLADNVTAHSYAYPANSFGNADKGTLRLKVNGSILQIVDLKTYGSGTSTNANGSGFTLSAAIPVKFQSGADFPARKYRTGTWIVNTLDLTNGYNTIVVEHEIEPGTIYQTQTIDYVKDSETTSTTFSSESMSDLVMSGSKYLSGVQYHTSGYATYSVTVSNAYRNTYNLSGTAISHPTLTNCSVSSSAIPNMLDELDDINVSKFATCSGTRILPSYQGGSGNRLGVNCRVLRTVQSTQTSSGVTYFYLLMDNASNSSTDLSNGFDDETRRFLSTSDFDNTSLSPNYTSNVSLLTLTSELQCYNSRLIYPSYDFSSITDGPSGNPNYSTCSGVRYFYGYFTNSVGASNFRFTLDGGGGITLVSLADFNQNSNHVTLEMKLPTQTGWLDCMKPFETGKWDDGDGCYAASFGNDTTIPTTNLGATVGTKNTANSGNRIYFRIKMGPGVASGNGYLTTVGVVWNAT